MACMAKILHSKILPRWLSAHETLRLNEVSMQKEYLQHSNY